MALQILTDGHPAQNRDEVKLQQGILPKFLEGVVTANYRLISMESDGPTHAVLTVRRLPSALESAFRVQPTIELYSGGIDGWVSLPELRGQEGAMHEILTEMWRRELSQAKRPAA